MIYIFLTALIFSGCESTKLRNQDSRLYCAIENNNVQGVKEVLEGSDVNLEKLSVKRRYTFPERTDERRALAIAMNSVVNDRDNKVAKLLIEAGADVNSKGSEGETYLNEALDFGWNIQDLETLLKAGADPSEKDGEGYTAVDTFVCADGLAYMQYSGNNQDFDKTLELLTNYGGKITKNTLKLYMESDKYRYAKDLVRHLRSEGKASGLKPDLEYAVCGENEELLEYLEKHKVSDKDLVLRQAAAHCSVPVLKKLKEKKCDFSIKDNDDANLLHIAAQYNTGEVVQYLLDEGMNPQKPDANGNSALTRAVIAEKKDNVKVFRKADINWQDWDSEDIDGASTWVNVCKSGGEESVDILLENNYKPTDGEIVYGYANCNESTLKALLKNEISYNTTYEEEGYAETGLEALCITDVQLAYELYKQASQIVMTPELFESIVCGGKEEFTKQAVEDYENISEKELADVLDAAVYLGQFELVKDLVQKGADINYIIHPYGEEEEYYTVMHTAASGTSEEILNYLVKQGGDISIKDSEGKRPFDLAKENGWYEKI